MLKDKVSTKDTIIIIKHSGDEEEKKEIDELVSFQHATKKSI